MKQPSPAPIAKKRLTGEKILIAVGIFFIALPLLCIAGIIVWNLLGSRTQKSALEDFRDDAIIIIEAGKNNPYGRLEDLNISEEDRTNTEKDKDYFYEYTVGEQSCEIRVTLAKPGYFGLPGDNIRIETVGAKYC